MNILFAFGLLPLLVECKMGETELAEVFITKADASIE
jgi:hypothetical protein